MLPEAVATFDGAKAIAQATRFSRWIYFVILAACAVCAIVIALPPMCGCPELVGDSLWTCSNAVPMSDFIWGALFIVLDVFAIPFPAIAFVGQHGCAACRVHRWKYSGKGRPWFLMTLLRRHYRWMREARSAQAISKP